METLFREKVPSEPEVILPVQGDNAGSIAVENVDKPFSLMKPGEKLGFLRDTFEIPDTALPVQAKIALDGIYHFIEEKVKTGEYADSKEAVQELLSSVEQKMGVDLAGKSSMYKIERLADFISIMGSEINFSKEVINEHKEDHAESTKNENIQLKQKQDSIKSVLTRLIEGI